MAKARKTGGLQKVIAANLKRLRLAKGISQEELAHICGYHRIYVGMIERGERNISIATPNPQTRPRSSASLAG